MIARLLVALALALAAAVRPDSRTDAVDKLFAQFARPDGPGCAIAVYYKGEIVYKHAYGMADLEHDVPLTPDSVFDIGSTAKQFTAASVILLAQQEKLKFTDSVRKYVPELPAYYDQVTLDHMLHHTSGMLDALALIPLIHDGLGQQHISNNESEAHDGLGDFHMSDEEFIELMTRQRSLAFQPGTHQQYSNSGYIMLSIVVKRASGKSLGEFARENIFDPLGMKNTKYVDDHSEIVRNRAIGYYPRLGGGFFVDSAPLDLVGDGGVYSTVEDLLRWNRNFDTGQVGGPELLNAMLKQGKLNDGKEFGYASGLSVLKYRGLNTVGHPGGMHAYNADFIRFPDQQFAAACLCNTRADPVGLTRQIASLYLVDKMKDDDPAASSASFGSRPQIIELKGVDLNEYAGDYYSDELQVTFRFIVEKNQLKWFGRKENNPVGGPLGGGRFFYPPGMELAFVRDAQRRVTGFTLAIRGADWRGPAPAGLTFTRVQR